MSRATSIFLAMALAFAAAVGGVFVGRALFHPPRADDNALHALLHNELHLSPDQAARIATIERDFAPRKATLEAELRADNADLARAIAAEHGYGPRVAAAVDTSHHTMGELQKATLEHVFAMRAVLRPDQAARFDTALVKALTVPAR